MNSKVPLDQLILTLLALAEAAPDLPPEALPPLSTLGDKLQKELQQLDPSDEEALVKLLSRTGRRLFVQLYFSQAAFKEAKIAWDQQLTVRVGLELDEWDEIDNPEQAISSSVARDAGHQSQAATPNALQRLGNTVSDALRDPQSFARNNQIVQRLASLVRLRWPR